MNVIWVYVCFAYISVPPSLINVLIVVLRLMHTILFVALMPNFMVLLSILLDSKTGKIHFKPHWFTVLKWHENVCVCVCVGGINLKCALRWHVHI